MFKDRLFYPLVDDAAGEACPDTGLCRCSKIATSIGSRTPKSVAPLLPVSWLEVPPLREKLAELEAELRNAFPGFAGRSRVLGGRGN